MLIFSQGLIFVATYTANTAAALLYAQPLAPVVTLEGISNTGSAKLCVRTAMASSFLLRES